MLSACSGRVSMAVILASILLSPSFFTQSRKQSRITLLVWDYQWSKVKEDNSLQSIHQVRCRHSLAVSVEIFWFGGYLALGPSRMFSTAVETCPASTSQLASTDLEEPRCPNAIRTCCLTHLPFFLSRNITCTVVEDRLGLWLTKQRSEKRALKGGRGEPGTGCRIVL